MTHARAESSRPLVRTCPLFEKYNLADAALFTDDP